ncbi:MAG: radical SAM/SPASM domain-containing protein [Candidatus Omnitrophica bacterium]|nr:radical SAM/SPASM domain-containing protein [Candidatus Omnitrophota bacterium]
MKVSSNQWNINGLLNTLRFHYGRGQGHLFAYIKNRIIWNYFPKFNLITKFPTHVDIETSSACNMACPMCYTLTDTFKRRVKRQLMDFELYKKIIDECVKNKVYSIRVSLRGEAFIHPDIIKMIKYAKEQGIKEVSSLTNLLALDSQMFGQLVECGMDWLTISFDGLGKTYESIRKPAKFEESYSKIQEFKKIKDKFGSKKPVLRIQTIWPAIKDNPEEFYDKFSPYVEQIVINTLIDYLHKDKDIVYNKNFICPVLWQRLIVGSDGQVLLCSYDEMNKEIVGDLNTQSIKEIWNGKKLNQMRELQRKKDTYKKLEVCKECCLPRKLVEEKINIRGKIFSIKHYVDRSKQVGQ